MKFHLGEGGYTDPKDMQEDPQEQMRNGETGSAKGDGLHHHEIHEDEGGGFHSLHTHPDGHEDHADHASYDEAKDHMDEQFGHEGDGDEKDDGMGDEGMDDGGGEDIAGAYGRACEG